MIVAPFRSNRSDAVVFHTNTLCPEAKAIDPSERLDGEGDLLECDSCHALARIRLAAQSAEEALRRDQRIMALAEVQAGFGVIIWIPGSDEILLSEGAFAINGLTPPGPMVAAEMVLSTIHPDDREAVASGLAAVAAGGEYNLRHRVIWPDGTIRWIRSRAQLMPETPDSPAYVLGTNIDVTDEVETA